MHILKTTSSADQYSLLYSIELQACGDNVLSQLLTATIAILDAVPLTAPSPPPNKNIKALRSPKGSISAPSSPKSTTTAEEGIKSLMDARIELVSLRRRAEEEIKSVHHTQVADCWRRLFTDTSLLIVLANVQLLPRRDDAYYKIQIGFLDEAIVIANAPGAGRLDMCHDAIARIQEEYLPLDDPACASSSVGGPSAPYPTSFEGASAPPDLRASKRPKRSTRNGLTTPTHTGSSPSAASSSPLPSSSNRNIPRLIDPPSVIEYRERYWERPFIVPRYAADWPACSNWGNPQYLRNVGGLGRKVPVETTAKPGDDYTSEAWTTTMMDWEEFIDLLCIRSAFSAKAKAIAANPAAANVGSATSAGSRPGTPSIPSPDAPPVPKRRGRPPLNRNLPPPVPVVIEEWRGETHYLAQHDLINQMPELRSDIIIPDYVYAAVPAPRWFPDYQPPAVDGELMMNSWIGPGGTITPPHKVNFTFVINCPIL